MDQAKSFSFGISRVKLTNLLKKRGCGEWDIAYSNLLSAGCSHLISSEVFVQVHLPVLQANPSLAHGGWNDDKGPRWPLRVLSVLEGQTAGHLEDVFVKVRGGAKGRSIKPPRSSKEEMRRMLETETPCSYNFDQSGVSLAGLFIQL